MKSTLAAVIQGFANPTIIKISLFFGIVKTYILQYVFADIDFLHSLVLLVGLDSVLGVAFALYKMDFDLSAFRKFFLKCLVYMSLLILGHVLTHLKVDGQQTHDFELVKNYIYMTMIATEAISILKFGARLFPSVGKGLLKYFREYDLNGTPQKLDKNEL